MKLVTYNILFVCLGSFYKVVVLLTDMVMQVLRIILEVTNSGKVSVIAIKSMYNMSMQPSQHSKKIPSLVT